MYISDRSGGLLVTAAILIVGLAGGILVSIYFQDELVEFVNGLLGR